MVADVLPAESGSTTTYYENNTIFNFDSVRLAVQECQTGVFSPRKQSDFCSAGKVGFS
ncbi:MAG: hypothetical protein MZW92_23075 [Comamonadaceae bacterium]|nr:hypothetical protein [Comamonadaceae bacterium]